MGRSSFRTVGAPTGLDHSAGTKGPVPTIAGPEPLTIATQLFAAFQQGKIDRSLLGSDFDAFLTPERLELASASFRELVTLMGLLQPPTAQFWPPFLESLTRDMSSWTHDSDFFLPNRDSVPFSRRVIFARCLHTAKPAASTEKQSTSQ
jgi:hypothetical protein